MIGLEISQSIRRRTRGGNKPSFIEMFSGAGLFGYAFKKEGFKPVAAYELDETAAATYRRNVCRNIVVGDLSTREPEGKCEVIVAGPPCVGFSTIRKCGSSDPRNSLCLVIPRWARATGAKVVVVENVPQFLRSAPFSMFREEMESYGFESTTWLVNARDYRVPQNRRRCIAVFSKIGLPSRPRAWARPRTVWDAFDGLPSAPVPEIQHFAREQSPETYARIRLIPPGGDIRHLAATHPELVPPSWFKTKGKIVDIWGRLKWGDVSNTIRTGFLHPSRGRFLHPTENRPITFREAARLQTIPDDFVFEGLPEQLARQIGNAVPFKMGRAIARSVRELF
jgi:DNA (cytosine-5)-methyltransferase 1